MVIFPPFSFSCPPGRQQAMIPRYWRDPEAGDCTREETPFLGCSSVGTWGAACRASGSVGASKAAASSWSLVPVMDGQPHVMEQIDHHITRHDLLISAKRAIHYRAHHRDAVIPTDNIPTALAWASYHPDAPSSRKKRWRSSSQRLALG